MLSRFWDGQLVHRVFLVLFLISNCYQCFNHSLSMFNLEPPTIEAYLPLDEVIPRAPYIHQNNLGEVYNFHSQF